MKKTKKTKNRVDRVLLSESSDSVTRPTMMTAASKFLSFSVFSRNRHPEKLHCTFFVTTKVSTLISIEGGKTLSRSLNNKIS